MKVVLLSGSLRKESLNKKFLIATKNLLPTSIESEILDLKSFSIPVYDGDVEDEKFPSGVTALGQKLSQAQAWILSTPEYNGGIAGSLKNVVDWLSRLKPHPFDKKPVLLMSASPGALGGIRGLLHSRQPLEVLGAYVYPQTFGLGKAHEAFSAQSDFIDSKTKERVNALVQEFLLFSQKVN